jgi:membrane associated rhomboid family serine protease
MFGGMPRGGQGPQGQQQGPSIGDRCSAWLKSIPLVCVMVITVNVVIYVFTLFDYSLVYKNAICPSSVLLENSFGGIFSSPWFHASFYHVLFNMLMLSCNGGRVETMMGSLPFLGVNLMFSVFTNILYVILSWLLYLISDDFAPLVTCAVGYSGVLFAILVIETELTPNEDRSCCCLPIPARLYPWFLLVFIQAVIPGVSMMGHLTGICVGIMYARGVLNFMTLSMAHIRALEEKPWLRWFTSHRRFKRAPEEAAITPCQINGTERMVAICCSGNCCSAMGSCCERLATRCAGLFRRNPDRQRAARSNRNGGYAQINNNNNSALLEDDDDVEQGGWRDRDGGHPVSGAARGDGKALPAGLNKLLDSVPQATPAEKAQAAALAEENKRQQMLHDVNRNVLRAQNQATPEEVDSYSTPAPWLSTPSNAANEDLDDIYD